MNSKKPESYTIIIPAFNEERNIKQVLSELGDLENCSEIIVVDDGSSDKTAAIAEEMGARVIRHAQNLGYGASLKSGIRANRSDYVVFIDGDGQHRKEDLLKVLKELGCYDMIIGARARTSSQTMLRRPGKFALKWFITFLANKKIPDFNSGLRALRSSLITKHLNLMPDGFSFSTTSTIAFEKMSYSTLYIPIVANPRVHHKSTVRLFKDGAGTFMLVLNLIVLFSPFRVFFPLSIVFVSMSFGYFIYYSYTEQVHINTTMVMLFITGFLSFMLGVICEQISAIRRELNIK